MPGAVDLSVKCSAYSIVKEQLRGPEYFRNCRTACMAALPT